MKIKFLLFAIMLSSACAHKAEAQVKIDDIIGKVEGMLGQKKLLTVKKGFSPVFNFGNLQINTVGLLGEKLKGINILGTIFDSKNVQQITKLYNTYKTGLVVYKILSAAGTVVSVYSTIRGATTDAKFNDKTVKTLLTSSLTSILTGVITKVLTKKASYKAVDIFNGVVTKKIKDILSIGPASANTGIGVYVKL